MGTSYLPVVTLPEADVQQSDTIQTRFLYRVTFIMKQIHILVFVITMSQQCNKDKLCYLSKVLATSAGHDNPIMLLDIYYSPPPFLIHK